VSGASAPRVFITGASSGIGAALAREYAARGALLGLTARRRELLDQMAGSLKTTVSVYPLDVRDVDALRNAAVDFIQCYGPPDVVIANAGVSAGTLTEEAEDLPVFQEIMDVNVMGMVNTFHAFLPKMHTRNSGTLVGIASVASARGLPGASAYSASKAAALRYLESLRVELYGSGVRVTTICPGYIKTAMTAENPYPMPFILDVDEAARRFVRAIDAQKSLVTIPWQMGIVRYLLRRLPNWLFDAAFSRAGRKPRR
jgi:short-subunit dehydrogenase